MDGTLVEDHSLWSDSKTVPLSGNMKTSGVETDEVFSVNQAQISNEWPTNNVNLLCHSNTTAFISPTTTRGGNLDESTWPILSDCEPLSFCSDEHENYDENISRYKSMYISKFRKIVKEEYIRQCRLSYSVFSTRPVGKTCKDPYAKCREIGVDFNVGSGEKQKLDFHLLTNDLMVEISQYAKEINRATMNVIYDVLDYNFDLSVKNEDQAVFCRQIAARLKVMRKVPSKQKTNLWLTEVFNLPYYKKVTKAKCSPVFWARSDSSSEGDNINQPESTMDQSSMMSLTEEALRFLYPLCKEKGVVLDTKSKCRKNEKLDLQLLTRGVMLEMADFASQIAGNYKEIVCDVLEQNFDLDLRNGKTELAALIMSQLSTFQQRSVDSWKFRLGNKAFLEKLCKQRTPDISKKKVTIQSLEQKYPRLKDVTRRGRLDLVSKKECIEIAKGSKEKKIRPVDPKCVSLESISDEIDNGLYADETRPIVVTTVTDKLNRCKTQKVTKVCNQLCQEIGLDLDVISKPAKTKLELNLLTKGVISEVHVYLSKIHCSRGKRANSVRYPASALYDILEYNFDLPFQKECSSQFAARFRGRVYALYQKHYRVLKTKGKISKEVFSLYSDTHSKVKKKKLSYFPEILSKRNLRKKQVPDGKDTISMETVSTAATFGKDNGTVDSISIKKGPELDIICHQEDWVETEISADVSIKKEPELDIICPQQDWVKTEISADFSIKKEPELDIICSQQDWVKTETSADVSIKREPELDVIRSQQDRVKTETSADVSIKKEPELDVIRSQQDRVKTETSADVSIKKEPELDVICPQQDWVKTEISADVSIKREPELEVICPQQDRVKPEISADVSKKEEPELDVICPQQDWVKTEMSTETDLHSEVQMVYFCEEQNPLGASEETLIISSWHGSTSSNSCDIRIENVFSVQQSPLLTAETGCIDIQSNHSLQTDETQYAYETSEIGHENGAAVICMMKEPELNKCPHQDGVKTETPTETDITICADEMACRLGINTSVPTLKKAMENLHPVCKKKGIDLDIQSTFGKEESDVTWCAGNKILGLENGAIDVCTRDESDLDLIYPQHVQAETFSTQTEAAMDLWNPATLSEPKYQRQKKITEGQDSSSANKKMDQFTAMKISNAEFERPVEPQNSMSGSISDVHHLRKRKAEFPLLENSKRKRPAGKDELEDSDLSVNSQLHICRKFIKDLMCDSVQQNMWIFSRFSKCFVVEISSENNFKHILAEYRSDILPLIIEGYGAMNHSEKTVISHVNELFCGLHLIEALARQVKTTLLLWENILGVMKLESSSFPSICMTPLEARTVRLIRSACDVVQELGRQEDCQLINFETILVSKTEFLEVPLSPASGDRIDSLFCNGAVVYCIYDDLVKLTNNHRAGKDLLAAFSADLQVPQLKAGCRALGLISKLIIDPLWEALTSKGDVLGMEQRYQTLVKKLKQWQDNGRDVVEGTAQLFDDIEVTKDLVFNRLTMCTETDHFELTVQVVELILASILEVCVKMPVDLEPASDIHDRCRRNFLVFESLQMAKSNAVSVAFEIFDMFKNNKSWEWLQTIDKGKKMSVLKSLQQAVKQQRILSKGKRAIELLGVCGMQRERAVMLKTRHDVA